VKDEGDFVFVIVPFVCAEPFMLQVFVEESRLTMSLFGECYGAGTVHCANHGQKFRVKPTANATARQSCRSVGVWVQMR
jgi:hypothetical protein